MPPAKSEVTWIKVDTVAELQQHCGTGTSYGCAHWGRQHQRCIIYTLKNPNEKFESLVLGHELKHCFEGHWHK